MKTSLKLFCIMMMLVQVPLFGQIDKAPIMKIFDKYEDRDGVEAITISTSLLNMMVEDKERDKTTRALIAKINKIRVLTVSKCQTDEGKKVKNELMSDFRPLIDANYSQLMKMKTADGERVEIYRSKECLDTYVKDSDALLFITEGKNELALMIIVGNIDSEMIEAATNGKLGITK